MSISEEKFLQIYGSLLVQSWEDAELKARLHSNPGEVLKEFGLDPGSATVEIIAPHADSGEECTPESAVQLWNDGLQAGKIQFVYPESLPEGAENKELSVEEMEAVAGGAGCCCTPCCCCSSIVAQGSATRINPSSRIANLAGDIGGGGGGFGRGGGGRMG